MLRRASVAVARLARSAVVIAAATAGAAGVQSQVDELARDARVGEPFERAARQVGWKLDEGEVRADLNGPEVVATQAALVRERADDLAGLHAVALADGDAVGGHARARLARTALGALAAVVAIEA